MNALRVNLADLAKRAYDEQQDGVAHATLAIDSQEIDPKYIAAIEQKALAGDEESQRTLVWIKEAREATFTNAFARASYFRGTIARLNVEANPDPEKVLASFFSAQATKMSVRGEDKKPTVQPAIPLFKSVDKTEARKYHHRPLRIAEAFRKNSRTSQEHIEGQRMRVLVPTTVTDRECFEQMSALLAKMPAAIAKHFEGTDNFDVRQAVWLCLNLIPGARVFGPGFAKRIFTEVEGDEVKDERDARFLRFELSNHEVLVLDKSEFATRIIGRLKVFKDLPSKLVKK
jgi:hypothetical protein